MMMCEERKKESWSLSFWSLSDASRSRLPSLLIRSQKRQNAKERKRRQKRSEKNKPSRIALRERKEEIRGLINRQVKRDDEWALFFFTTLLHTNNIYSCEDGESVKETERSFERRRQTGGVFMSEEEEIRCVRVERDSPSSFCTKNDEAFFLR